MFTTYVDGGHSVTVGTLSLADNRLMKVYEGAHDWADAKFVDSRDLLVEVTDDPDALTLYRVTPGQAARRIGSSRLLIPPNKTVISVTYSRNLKKALVVTREDLRDVWMAKVVR